MGGDRAPPRRCGQEPGCKQPHKHRLRCEAADGSEVLGPSCAGRHEVVALQSHLRWQRRRQATHRGHVPAGAQAVLPRGDLFHGLDVHEEDGRGVSWDARPKRRGDCARLLQRLPAPGHEGCGRDRGLERAPHCERAHGSRNRLRSRSDHTRQRGGDQHPHFRHGWRHLRCLHFDDPGYHLRGESHGRRPAPRGRGLRQPHAQLLHRGVPAEV
mmetsp:Transcript_2836/g.5933  ORF Transcript_2836/g.5933 Transcript_2836/m.5933 type:complete len:213 (+) Transcript_2836:254-892(+)